MTAGPTLRSAPGVPLDWARAVWREAAAASWRHARVPLPAALGAGEAVVKAYRRRPAHGPVRRLRAGRARREAAGHAAFADRSLRTAELLLWGEARRLGLLELGLVVTRAVPAPTVAERALEPSAAGLLEDAIGELAAIHGAGLAHGDARTRNFLATEPAPLAFDLAAWGRGTRPARARDLATFLASATVLTGGTRALPALLERYARDFGALPGTRARLLRAAARRAATFRRP